MSLRLSTLNHGRDSHKVIHVYLIVGHIKNELLKVGSLSSCCEGSLQTMISRTTIKIS